MLRINAATSDSDISKRTVIDTKDTVFVFPKSRIRGVALAPAIATTMDPKSTSTPFSEIKIAATVTASSTKKRRVPQLPLTSNKEQKRITTITKEDENENEDGVEIERVPAEVKLNLEMPMEETVEGATIRSIIDLRNSTGTGSTLSPAASVAAINTTTPALVPVVEQQQRLRQAQKATKQATAKRNGNKNTTLHKENLNRKKKPISNIGPYSDLIHKQGVRLAVTAPKPTK